LDIAGLIDQYCAVWSTADADSRARLLHEVWAGDATYTDPTTPAIDAQGLLAHIARVQLNRPGATVRRCTVVDEHHGWLRFGFEVIARDGACLRSGTDFAKLSADRRQLQQVVGFFGNLTR
jgi:hypothetical protein